MAFTSVLVRMYISYVVRCLLDIDLTLEDEKKLIDTVYTYGSDLMYKFFWETNYCFFISFLGFFLMSIIWATVLVFQKLNMGHMID